LLPPSRPLPPSPSSPLAFSLAPPRTRAVKPPAFTSDVLPEQQAAATPPNLAHEPHGPRRHCACALDFAPPRTRLWARQGTAPLPTLVDDRVSMSVRPRARAPLRSSSVTRD
ncbi:hypothetical protein CERSUDRAFT_101468, partial [Gelatoporia subvermispora B]